MRLFARPARPCDELGFGLVGRIAALQTPHRVHRLRWRWMLDWWDARRGTRRRGVRVA